MHSESRKCIAHIESKTYATQYKKYNGTYKEYIGFIKYNPKYQVSTGSISATLLGMHSESNKYIVQYKEYIESNPYVSQYKKYSGQYKKYNGVIKYNPKY